MNKGANVDLNWYWQKWYFDKAIPDLAISKVFIKNQSCVITISNAGGAPVPIHLTIYYANGSTQAISRNITIWKNKDKFDLEVKEKSKIVKITLGNPYDADINISNNSWSINGVVNK